MGMSDEAKEPEDHSETCQRCGDRGEDRRTLRMACFYAMNELGLPFKEQILWRLPSEDAIKSMTKAKEPAVLELPSGGSINLGGGSVNYSGELFPMDEFTLRVCKDCRADWMEAIREWFYEKPSHLEEQDPEANIPIRENGAVRMITLEEWERRRREKGD